MGSTEQLEQLRDEAMKRLREVADGEALEQWRVRYLGMKGALKAAMQRLRDLSKADRPAYGQLANDVKNALTAALEQCRQDLAAAAGPAQAAAMDMTVPGRPVRLGRRHIITQTIDEITEIFARMGFTVAYGPEVEDEHHNFDALNIPAAHTARDPLDNFYITPSVMLRSQTSTVQIRVMESQPPPVRVISPGRVYRPDTVDATHSFMFHQLEGLHVDEGISMVDLKTAIDQFCKAYFGPEVRTRFRPSFFPFTEPSAEVDLLFGYADGSTAWIELGGCGMVDPNVLDTVGYDSEKYTGWAFGLGIERMVMRKHQIPDIRLLFANDVRFLRQF